MKRLQLVWLGLISTAMLISQGGGGQSYATQATTQLFLPAISNLANWNNPFGIEVEIGANVKPGSIVLA